MFHLAGHDSSCPQYITSRPTEADPVETLSGVRARVEELELEQRGAQTGIYIDDGRVRP